MDARLPPTLRVNRGDIKELNERANLIKIINDRKNALKKRKELQKEYDDIMKRLFKSLQKKKKKLARGRGGIRTSRSWEKRQQERQKRGERRAEGEDEPSIIGEEVKQDSQGNMIITYRDYEKEAQAKAEADVMRDALRIEDRQERQLQMDRLDQIRREDIQLRFDERQRDRDDRLRREDEQFRIARENRTHEDLWRDLIMRRDDERDELNRIIEGRRLDIAQEQMGQGRQFIDALRDLELRFNQRFDAAEVQYRNLLQTNPGGIEIQDLQQQNPQLGQPQEESEFRELRDDVEATPTLQEILEEEEDILPTEETDEDFEGPQRPQRGIPTPQRPSQERPELPPRDAPEQPYKPPQARMYTEDLKPQGEDYGVKVGGEKEDRQPRGAGRSLAEDLEIIDRIGGITAPPEGTPERIEWDNLLFSGKLDVKQPILEITGLALQEIAEENRVANLMREANNERLQIQELKDREQELQERIVKEGQARDLTLSAEKIRKQIIDEESGEVFTLKNPVVINPTFDKFTIANPNPPLLEKNKQEIIDTQKIAPREVIQVNPLLEDERFLGFLTDVYNGAISENPKQFNLKNKNRQFFINKGYANQDEALRDALDVFGIRYRKKDNKTTLMRKLQAEIDDGDYKERLNTRYGGSVKGTSVYRKLDRAIGGFSGSSEEEGESTQGASGPQGEDVADLPLPYESPPSPTLSQSGTSSDDDPNVYTHIPFSDTSSEDVIELGPMTEEEIAEDKRQEEEKERIRKEKYPTTAEQYDPERIHKLRIELKERKESALRQGRKFKDDWWEGDGFEQHIRGKRPNYEYIEILNKEIRDSIEKDGDGEHLNKDRALLKELQYEADILEKKEPALKFGLDASRAGRHPDPDWYYKGTKERKKAEEQGMLYISSDSSSGESAISSAGESSEEGESSTSQPQGEDTAELPQPKFNIDELQKGMRIKVKGEQEGKILNINRDEGQYKGAISFRTPDMPTMRKVLYPHEHHEIEDIGGFATEQKGPGSMRNILKHKFERVTRALKLPMGEKFVSPPQPTLEGMRSEESVEDVSELSTASSSSEDEGDKFIPGKYTKGQQVSYYRVEKGKGGWRQGTIGNYQDGGPDGALLSVKIGKRGKEVETTMDKVIAKPNAGELLKQKELREELKGGILREGENRKADKKGSFWEGKDKYLIHNNTPHEFRGIQPYGKSLIHYHKDNPQQHKGQKGKKFTEFSYYHTPLDNEGKGMEQATGKRIIAPKTLDPALEKGLLRIEKLDEAYPYEIGSKKEKLEKKGRPFGTKEGFIAPEPEPSMLAGAGEVVGNIAGGVASAGAGLIGGIAGGVAAQLPTPYEAGVGVGGALAGAGVGLLQGAAGLVAGAIGGGAESDSDESI